MLPVGQKVPLSANPITVPQFDLSPKDRMKGSVLPVDFSLAVYH